MRKTAAFTTAFALMAAPAFAQGPDRQPPRGHTVSPAKICSKVPGLSKQKTPGTRGQSSWAACVSGVRRQNDEARREGGAQNLSSPTATCRAIQPALSRKRRTAGEKSPWAACVSGAARAQRELKAAARD